MTHCNILRSNLNAHTETNSYTVAYFLQNGLLHYSHALKLRISNIQYVFIEKSTKLQLCHWRTLNIANPIKIILSN